MWSSLLFIKGSTFTCHLIVLSLHFSNLVNLYLIHDGFFHQIFDKIFGIRVERERWKDCAYDGTFEDIFSFLGACDFCLQAVFHNETNLAAIYPVLVVISFKEKVLDDMSEAFQTVLYPALSSRILRVKQEIEKGLQNSVRPIFDEKDDVWIAPRLIFWAEDAVLLGV